MAAQMGLNGGVLFTGPLYDDAKWAAYRDADLFVLPSQNENFGNTAAEAVACGTPVLVTDRCGIAPIVDQRAGVVVPHDCAALEAGLARFWTIPSSPRDLRTGCAGGRQFAGLGRAAGSKWNLLYRELISEQARPNEEITRSFRHAGSRSTLC